MAVNHRHRPSRAARRALISTSVGRTALVLALLAGWMCAYLLVLSRFEQARTQRALYTSMRTQLAEGLAPVAEPIASGSPVAVLTIPDAGIHDLVVVQGTSGSVLQAGPGHVPGTSLPGENGACVIFGRRSTFGAPFHALGRLHPGSQISITTGAGSFRYRVDGLSRGGTVEVPQTQGRLFLVTASGSGALGWLAPGDTLDVNAELLGVAQADSSRATTLPAADRAMGVDHSAVTRFELIGALQLLLVSVLGTAWALRRWGHRQAWIAGVPVVLCAAWLSAGLIARLLPNLL